MDYLAVLAYILTYEIFCLFLFHSLLTYISYQFQSVAVNSNTTAHHYRSFFYNLISTSKEEKDTSLATEAYYFESGSEVGLKTSESFKTRMNLFKSNDNYVTTNVILCGQLYHDLVVQS